MRYALVALPCVFLLCGCETVTPIVEYTHISHATQHIKGLARGPNGATTNYGADIISVGIRWRPEDNVTVDLLEGYSLQSLHGYHETFTGRITWEIGK